jgi:hypothetical protein
LGGDLCFDGALVNGLATGQIPNADLKWEEAENLM